VFKQQAINACPPTLHASFKPAAGLADQPFMSPLYPLGFAAAPSSTRTAGQHILPVKLILFFHFISGPAVVWLFRVC